MVGDRAEALTLRNGPSATYWADRVVNWMTGLSGPRAFLYSLALMSAIFWFDWATGALAWCGPLYLVAICLPTWTLGTRAGLVAGIFCAALSYLINKSGMSPEFGLVSWWNMAMRAFGVMFVIFFVGGFRRSLDREWQRARTDELTGALTKQAFDERCFGSHRHRAARALLAYIDLDSFKPINDRHGHAAGDDVLRAFTRAALARIGADGSFARLGGDEFLLFVPVASDEAGQHMAEAWHGYLNEELAGLPWPCTCSMGALVVDPRTMSQDDIERADRLMYAAKRGPAPRLRIADGANATFEPLVRRSISLIERSMTPRAAIG